METMYNDVPQYLYHYKRLGHGLAEISDKSIWLARLADFSDSDPNEGRTVTTDEKTARMIAEAPLTDRQRMIIGEPFQGIYDVARSKVRTVSMTDSPLNRHMWENYAGLSGVCICYSYQSLLSHNLGFKRVTYTDERHRPDDHGWLNVQQEIIEAAMKKGTEFALEREYRHLHLTTEYNPYSIDQRFVRAPEPECVYIGEDAEVKMPDLYRRVVDVCTSSMIPMRTVSRDDLIDLGPWKS